MWRIALLVLNGFNVVSCLIGWTALVLVGVPEATVAEIMRPGTFTSFVIPGWLLLLVVGGTQLLAFIALLRRWQYAPLFTAIAGFGMVIWIYVEVVLMREANFAHHLWGATGLLEIGCLLAMLGVFQPDNSGELLRKQKTASTK